MADLTTRYSSLRTMAGCTRDARQAGSPEAATAMTTIDATATTKVAASAGRTPNSIDVIRRVSPNPTTAPATTPIAVSESPGRIT